MLKWFTGLLASISSIFITATDKPNIVPPLNMSVIAYQETYFAPVAADLGNFPHANSSKAVTDNQEVAVKKEIKITPPPVAPIPIPSPPIPPLAPVLPPQDPYLATPEPMTSWLSMNLIMKGDSNDTNNPRVLPEITFDREYWRVEAFAYWAPDIIPPKPDIQSDYFKLEVYEKGTDKLIYTMTSGDNETSHKFQSFRKPGVYYFKVHTKNPSEWEISFVVSPKLAQ